MKKKDQAKIHRLEAKIDMLLERVRLLENDSHKQVIHVPITAKEWSIPLNMDNVAIC